MDATRKARRNHKFDGGGEFNTGRKHMAYRWWLLYTTEATDKQTVRQTDRYMDSIIA